MTIINWFKSLTTEDAKRAWVRFSKTFVYVALVLGLRYVLGAVQDSTDPIEALKDIEIWKSGLDVVIDSLLVGLIWGTDKIARSGQYHK